MDVRCERCRAQYVFDDGQVTPSGLAVQCTNCGHVFKVKKKELVVTVPVKPDELQEAPLPATAAAPKPAAVAAAPPKSPAAPASRAEPDRPREWRVRQGDGNTFTFRELTTLQKWIIERKVSRHDEISFSGDQWQRLGNIAELASFFQVVEAAERTRAQLAQPPTAPPSAPRPAVPERRPESRSRRSSAESDADVLAADAKRAGIGSGRARLWIPVAMLLGAAGAAGYVFGPPLLASARRPSQGPPPPTAETSPQPPEPAAPPVEPVPAPEPVAEPALQSPPEPIVAQPTKAAPKGPKALLAQARRALEGGNTRVALELFGRVASQDPMNAEALTGRGLCYLDLENYAPAEASFLAALRAEPGQPDALLGLAETYRFEGKKAEAISHYEKYLSEHPQGDDAEVARNALAELRK